MSSLDHSKNKKRTLLHDEKSVVIQPEIVRRLGNLADAAVLQQLNYWMPHAKVEYEGRWWVFKSYENWSTEIGISEHQVRRAMDRLVEAGVVSVCNPRGRTNHYAINYDHVLLDGADSPDTYLAPVPDDVAPMPDDLAPVPAYKEVKESTKKKSSLAASPQDKPAKRDELFEAVAEATGIDWKNLTSSGRGPLNKAVKELRDIGVTPDQVGPRATAYRKTYPDAPLTPMALTKHWAALTPAGTVRRSSRPSCEYCDQPLDDHDQQVCEAFGRFR
jgi:DNA-binding Lrp family transcriptional regulator